MSVSELEIRSKKLLEINKTIAKLDPAIRASAFEVLKEACFGDERELREKNKVRTQKKETPADASEFYSAHGDKKPSDNVFTIVAWFYSQYGIVPLTKTNIAHEAGVVGMTIPARPDLTMKQATKSGKKLFNQVAKGYQLTVHGENFVKEIYKVKKGNKPFPSEDAE